ncbi:MAG: V-type ATP synthase subunit I [Treponema sp.]|nr:V-type ATP synthase subunit I [Treponema sp.]
MLRPRKMKFLELTVFKEDMDRVLEYLGRKSVIQFPEKEGVKDNQEVTRVRRIITRLIDAGDFLGVDLKTAAEKNLNNPAHNVVKLPSLKSEETVKTICLAIEKLKEKQIKTEQEKSRVREAINEASSFSKTRLPFSDFEHLSFLTLRFGRLDPKGAAELRKNLGDRAVIIPLNTDNRYLAASSKKGRFALDSQLKKVSFEPIAVPENFKGVPEEMMISLKEQNEKLENELERLKAEKEQIKKDFSDALKELMSSWNIALVIEGIKAGFTATENLYHFSGWIPADISAKTADDLTGITGGRIAINSYSPNEVPSVKSGKEKVPVAMKHNAFVKGFESVVFSYGAPLYGTIDPTPIVAFFFTLMFGIMFGDAGQGLVLLLAGVFLSRTKNKLIKFKKFSIPLMSVGTASIIMGLLAGSVFTNEKLLVVPTRELTSALFGQPMDRILHILPMAGEGGSITKLLYFFGFTVAIGVILNSLGLIINIFNRVTLKNYKAAFFSKTGLCGLLFFWYALFIALRIIFGGRFHVIDLTGLIVPILFIFFGDVIWKIIKKEKPVFEHGLLAFFMEGFVEIMETVSSYFSNTVSFLRVGAFALAHAVFSFIIFYFTDELARSGFGGALSAALIMILGNAIIIVLEGLIVAIQVIRLQYYEFFNKFFVETGVEFAPFSFKNKEYS